MTNENKRTEFLGAKATVETKNYFQNLKKDTGKSLADIIEMMATSKITGVELEVLYKAEGLQLQIENNTRLIKRVEDLANYIKSQNELLIKEVNTLTKTRPKSKNVDVDPEVNIRTSVNSYFETMNKQTNSFGTLNPNFDHEKVAKNICSYHNANTRIFWLCVDAINNNEFSLDEFNLKTFDELGIEM